MDINIWPNTLIFFPNFVSEKVWLKNTLPTYDLDISPKFCIFFFRLSLIDLYCYLYTANNRVVYQSISYQVKLWPSLQLERFLGQAHLYCHTCFLQIHLYCDTSFFFYTNTFILSHFFLLLYEYIYAVTLFF